LTGKGNSVYIIEDRDLVLIHPGTVLVTNGRFDGVHPFGYLKKIGNLRDDLSVIDPVKLRGHFHPGHEGLSGLPSMINAGPIVIGFIESLSPPDVRFKLQDIKESYGKYNSWKEIPSLCFNVLLSPEVAVGRS
jgi:hypothetical protein